MKLNEFFSYKTQFAFSKNEIEHGFYKDVTEQELKVKNINKLTLDDLYSLYEKTQLMVILKTKYGYFIKFNFKNNDYLKNFISHNSSVFCAIFTSHRVSDTYTFGYAEKGQIKRFFSVVDGEVICEGTESIYEKNVTHKLKIPSDEELISYVNEDDILSCINNCIGFDIEKEDIEILDCKVYEWTGVNTEISQKIVSDIFNNICNQSFSNASIQFIKSKNSKNILILATASINEEENIIYSFFCNKNFTYDSFLEGYHSAMYCLSNFNFLDSNMLYQNNIESKYFNDLRLFKSLKLRFDSIISCNFKPNNNNDVYIYLTKIGNKYTNKKRAINNSDILENYFPEKDDRLVYKFIKQNINRKFFKIFGHWNLQLKNAN